MVATRDLAEVARYRDLLHFVLEMSLFDFFRQRVTALESPNESLGLPSGLYYSHHMIEAFPTDRRFTVEGKVQLPKAAFSKQLLCLSTSLKLKEENCGHLDPKEMIVTTYLWPVVPDASKFRKTLEGTSVRWRDYSDEFSGTPEDWSFRDSSYCQSWMIDIVCDDASIASIYKNHGE